MGTYAMTDNCLDQSVEFLSEGIRYYQFNGLVANLKYFLAVLVDKDKDIMKFYRYEDITKVCIYTNLKYMNIGAMKFMNQILNFIFVMVKSSISFGL